MDQHSFLSLIQDIDEELGDSGSIFLNGDTDISIQLAEGPPLSFGLLNEDCVLLSVSGGSAQPVSEQELIESIAILAGDWFQSFGISVGMIPGLGHTSLSLAWPTHLLSKNVDTFAIEIRLLAKAAELWLKHLEGVKLTTSRKLPDPTELVLDRRQSTNIVSPLPAIANFFREESIGSQIKQCDDERIVVELSEKLPALTIEKGIESVKLSLEFEQPEEITRGDLAEKVLNENFGLIESQGQTFALAPTSRTIFSLFRYPLSRLFDLDSFLKQAALFVSDSLFHFEIDTQSGPEEIVTPMTKGIAL